MSDQQFTHVKSIVQIIQKHLDDSGLGVTFHDSAVEMLEQYVTQPGIESFSYEAVAQAIAVIAWSAAGKAMSEAAMWANMPQGAGKVGKVHRTDITQVIIMTHLPDDPDDPCLRTIHAIQQTGIADRILPKPVKEALVHVAREYA